jgi:cytochrome c oxidase cbb3-type subunit 3
MNSEPKRGHFAKEKGEVVLREHEYDGIQEYDQKLPNWWLFTFYGAIVWFVVYWLLYYNSSIFKTDQQNVEARIAAVQQIKQKELEETLASLSDSILVHTWAADPSIVAAGEGIYQVHCTACHAADLTSVMDVAGTKIPLPGLPLTDGQWKFGGKPMDVFKIIHDGSPPESDGHNGAKMQIWSQMLTSKEIAEVTAYIISKVPQDFATIEP